QAGPARLAGRGGVSSVAMRGAPAGSAGASLSKQTTMHGGGAVRLQPGSRGASGLGSLGSLGGLGGILGGGALGFGASSGSRGSGRTPTFGSARIPARKTS
ncbi:hypothetical protein CYMTET_18448, partial [Cymbomonas tetramitiformis]